MKAIPDKKIARENQKVEDAAETLDDAALTEVVADAAEDVAAEEAAKGKTRTKS